jgi:hypothetical protein
MEDRTERASRGIAGTQLPLEDVEAQCLYFVFFRGQVYEEGSRYYWISEFLCFLSKENVTYSLFLR